MYIELFLVATLRNVFGWILETNTAILSFCFCFLGGRCIFFSKWLLSDVYNLMILVWLINRKGSVCLIFLVSGPRKEKERVLWINRVVIKKQKQKYTRKYSDLLGLLCS